MNKFQINDNHKDLAKQIIGNLSSEKARKRAYISSLGVNSIAQYLIEQGFQPDDTNALHIITKLLEEFEIADLAVNNLTIDTRVVIGEDYQQMWIPRNHFSYGIFPDIYVGIKINNELSEATIEGFVVSSELKEMQSNSNYYIIEKSNLKPIEQLAEVLNTLPPRKHVCSEEEKEKAKGLFLSYIENDITQIDKEFLLKHLVVCYESREELNLLFNFENIFCEFRKHPNILDDRTLEIFSGDFPSQIGNVTIELETDEKAEVSSLTFKAPQDSSSYKAPSLTYNDGKKPILDEDALFEMNKENNNQDEDENSNEEEILEESSNTIEELTEETEAEDLLELVQETEEESVLEEASIESLEEIAEEAEELLELVKETKEENVLEKTSTNDLEKLNEESEAEELLELVQATEEENVLEETNIGALEELSEESEAEELLEFVQENEEANIEELETLTEESETEELLELVKEPHINILSDDNDNDDIYIPGSIDGNEPTANDILNFNVEDSEKEVEIDIIPDDDEQEENSEINPNELLELVNEEPIQENVEYADASELLELVKESSSEQNSENEPLVEPTEEEISENELLSLISENNEETQTKSQSTPEEYNDISEDDLLSLLETDDDEVLESDTEENTEVSQEISLDDIPEEYKDITDPNVLKLLFNDENTDNNELIEEVGKYEEETSDKELIQISKPPNNTLKIAATVAIIGALAGGAYMYKDQLIPIMKSNALIAEQMNKIDKLINKNKQPINEENNFITNNNEQNIQDVANNINAKQELTPTVQTEQKQVPVPAQDLPKAPTPVTDIPKEEPKTQQAPKTPEPPPEVAKPKSKDINTVIAKALMKEHNAVRISKISWEIEKSLAADPSISKYLTFTGRAVKINLAQELLVAQDRVFGDTIKIDITYNNKGKHLNSKIKISSGSKEIDNITLTTVNETLKYANMPEINTNKGEFTATLAINL